MNKTIHIREAVTPEEVERFWQELHAYHARDIFPDPAEEDPGIFSGRQPIPSRRTADP